MASAAATTAAGAHQASSSTAPSLTGPSAFYLTGTIRESTAISQCSKGYFFGGESDELIALNYGVRVTLNRIHPAAAPRGADDADDADDLVALVGSSAAATQRRPPLEERLVLPTQASAVVAMAAVPYFLLDQRGTRRHALFVVDAREQFRLYSFERPVTSADAAVVVPRLLAEGSLADAFRLPNRSGAVIVAAHPTYPVVAVHCYERLVRIINCFPLLSPPRPLLATGPAAASDGLTVPPRQRRPPRAEAEAEDSKREAPEALPTPGVFDPAAVDPVTGLPLVPGHVSVFNAVIGEAVVDDIKFAVRPCAGSGAAAAAASPAARTATGAGKAGGRALPQGATATAIATADPKSGPFDGPSAAVPHVIVAELSGGLDLYVLSIDRKKGCRVLNVYTLLLDAAQCVVGSQGTALQIATAVQNLAQPGGAASELRDLEPSATFLAPLEHGVAVVGPHQVTFVQSNAAGSQPAQQQNQAAAGMGSPVPSSRRHQGSATHQQRGSHRVVDGGQAGGATVLAHVTTIAQPAVAPHSKSYAPALRAVTTLTRGKTTSVLCAFDDGSIVALSPPAVLIGGGNSKEASTTDRPQQQEQAAHAKILVPAHDSIAQALFRSPAEALACTATLNAGTTAGDGSDAVASLFVASEQGPSLVVTMSITGAVIESAVAVNQHIGPVMCIAAAGSLDADRNAVVVDGEPRGAVGAAADAVPALEGFLAGCGTGRNGALCHFRSAAHVAELVAVSLGGGSSSPDDTATATAVPNAVLNCGADSVALVFGLGTSTVQIEPLSVQFTAPSERSCASPGTWDDVAVSVVSGAATPDGAFFAASLRDDRCRVAVTRRAVYSLGAVASSDGAWRVIHEAAGKGSFTHCSVDECSGVLVVASGATVDVLAIDECGSLSRPPVALAVGSEVACMSVAGTTITNDDVVWLLVSTWADASLAIVARLYMVPCGGGAAAIAATITSVHDDHERQGIHHHESAVGHPAPRPLRPHSVALCRVAAGSLMVVVGSDDGRLGTVAVSVPTSASTAAAAADDDAPRVPLRRVVALGVAPVAATRVAADAIIATTDDGSAAVVSWTPSAATPATDASGPSCVVVDDSLQLSLRIVGLTLRNIIGCAPIRAPSRQSCSSSGAVGCGSGLPIAFLTREPSKSSGAASGGGGRHLVIGVIGAVTGACTAVSVPTGGTVVQVTPLPGTLCAAAAVARPAGDVVVVATVTNAELSIRDEPAVTLGDGDMCTALLPIEFTVAAPQRHAGPHVMGAASPVHSHLPPATPTAAPYSPAMPPSAAAGSFGFASPATDVRRVDLLAVASAKLGTASDTRPRSGRVALYAYFGNSTHATAAAPSTTTGFVKASQLAAAAAGNSTQPRAAHHHRDPIAAAGTAGTSANQIASAGGGGGVARGAWRCICDREIAQGAPYAMCSAGTNKLLVAICGTVELFKLRTPEHHHQQQHQHSHHGTTSSIVTHIEMIPVYSLRVGVRIASLRRWHPHGAGHGPALFIAGDEHASVTALTLSPTDDALELFSKDVSCRLLMDSATVGSDAVCCDELMNMYTLDLRAAMHHPHLAAPNTQANGGGGSGTAAAAATRRPRLRDCVLRQGPEWHVGDRLTCIAANTTVGTAAIASPSGDSSADLVVKLLAPGAGVGAVCGSIRGGLTAVVPMQRRAFSFFRRVAESIQREATKAHPHRYDPHLLTAASCPLRLRDAEQSLALGLAQLGATGSATLVQSTSVGTTSGDGAAVALRRLPLPPADGRARGHLDGDVLALFAHLSDANRRVVADDASAWIREQVANGWSCDGVASSSLDGPRTALPSSEGPLRDADAAEVVRLLCGSDSAMANASSAAPADRAHIGGGGGVSGGWLAVTPAVIGELLGELRRLYCE